MYRSERKKDEQNEGSLVRSNATQLAKKDADSKWESIVQLAKKRNRKGTVKKKEGTDEDVSSEEDASSEDVFSDEESGSYSSQPRKKVHYESEVPSSSSSEEDSGDDYVEKQSSARPRFTFNSQKVENVIKGSAHKRENFDKKKFKDVYTCPACRRPIASIKQGSKNMDLVPYSYRSKKNKHLKTQRSAVLDHYPPWAQRYDALKSKNASEEEIREDHDDESRLRAMCKKCNESHKYESKKTVDYKSDTDESGYETDTEEVENVGNHSPFKFHKDEDKDGKGGTGGVTV